MQVKTVKLNLILNLIRSVLGTLFILLTIPYVSRVLGPDKLGRVEYVNSIIMYFMLFTVLGIPNYGVREVAKYRDNKRKLTKLMIELFLILLVMMVLGYVILIFMLYRYKTLFEIKDIVWVMSINIICNSIGVEWFYQGIENQLYITKRFVLAKILGIILLFLLVKTRGDYLIYALILVILQGGSNILNFINLRKYLNLKSITWKRLNIMRHLKPILIIFSATAATTIYSQLDSVMIGNINKTAVSIYVIPNKIIKLLLLIITAMGIVTVPRLSNCLKNKDYKNYNFYLKNSLNYIWILSVPAIFATFLLADDIIFLLAGEQYTDSILTLKILCPILFLIGIAYYIGYQILYPLGLEKYYTISVIVAALVNFIFNYLMIPKYLQNGAAIGTIIAETIGPLITLFFARKYLRQTDFFSIKRIKYVIAALVMSIVIYLIKQSNYGHIGNITISTILGLMIYIAILIILKEEICVQIIRIIKNKLYKNKIL